MSVGSNYSRLSRRSPDAVAAMTRRVRPLTLRPRRMGLYLSRIARFRGVWHTLCPWSFEHENTNVTPHDRSDDLSRVFGSGSVLLCSRSRDSSRKEELSLRDRKSTRLNSSHLVISYAVFCLKKKQ